MSSDFTVKFYGCRGSLPVSGKQHTRYGGATACVVVSVEGRDIIFDAGSGLKNYGDELLQRNDQTKSSIYLFVTHTHFDHLIGLPYFAPIYRMHHTLYLYGPRTAGFTSFQQSIEALIRSPYYPVELHEMASTKHFQNIGQSDIVYLLKDSTIPVHVSPERDTRPDPDEILCEIHCLRGLNHPKCGVNIYKVVYDNRSVVFATDIESYALGDRRLMQFAENADILIHDAMYTNEQYTSPISPTQGYGHSTVEIAAQMAIACNAKKLFLFHHAPASTDDDLDRIDALGKSIFAESAVAADGLHVFV